MRPWLNLQLNNKNFLHKRRKDFSVVPVIGRNKRIRNKTDNPIPDCPVDADADFIG